LVIFRVVAAEDLSLSRKTFFTFATFGRITRAQYGWLFDDNYLFPLATITFFSRTSLLPLG